MGANGDSGMTVEIICGDAREALARFPDRHFHCCVTSPLDEARTLRARIVQRPDFSEQALSLSDDRRSLLALGWRSTQASDLRVLAYAESEGDVGLPCLDTQVRAEGRDDFGCNEVGPLPAVEGASVSSGRALEVAAAAERRLEQIDGLRADLLDSDHLLILRVPVLAENAGRVGGALDTDVTIAINDSRKVGEQQLIHICSIPPSGGEVFNGPGVVTAAYLEREGRGSTPPGPPVPCERG